MPTDGFQERYSWVNALSDAEQLWAVEAGRLVFRWHPRIRSGASCVAPVRGGTYFSLQRQRKVGKRKPLLYLRCPPG
ncbi:hypothetical protein PSAB6_180064 [Paraburkholderia sabiae]|nr:hypothetical protein PSAB6_180064 [Paraburkholderia sabiae]